MPFADWKPKDFGPIGISAFPRMTGASHWVRLWRLRGWKEGSKDRRIRGVKGEFGVGIGIGIGFDPLSTPDSDTDPDPD